MECAHVIKMLRYWKEMRFFAWYFREGHGFFVLNLLIPTFLVFDCTPLENE